MHGLPPHQAVEHEMQLRQLPLQRLGDPGEVAKVIVFLAGPGDLLAGVRRLGGRADDTTSGPLALQRDSQSHLNREAPASQHVSSDVG